MAPVEELALLDMDRSNKGASKQRRDQINAEINIMRDLLPLPASSRQRLSQLQIMSLSCVYIRKCNILQKLFRCQSHEQNIPDSLDFFQAMTGFLLVTTREGKLLYISENVTDFLGHSMVDMKTQGDSLYDIVDKRDHGTVQAQLLRGGSVEMKEMTDVSFFCRMNMSRTLKRQSGFGDVKVMHIRGHFIHVNNTERIGAGDSQVIFLASCSPLITPDLKETLVQNNTLVFKTIHQLDMTLVEVTKMAEYHLGYSSQELSKKSWYSMLHPEDIHEAKEKHTQLIRSNHEMGCMVTVRMLKADGTVVWLNIVMQVRQSSLPHSEEPYIVCINQVISAQEAYQIKMQSQMFSVYPGRVQEIWRNHMAESTPSPSNSSQWIPNGNIPALVPGYQNGISIFVNQPEYSPIYHSMSSSNLPGPGQDRKSCVGVAAGKMNSVVHTDKLKAMLKRKIQGPGPSCRPMKMAKISWDSNGMQDGHGYSEMGHMMPQDDHQFYGGGAIDGDSQNQSVHVLQPSNYRFGVLQAKKGPKTLGKNDYIHLSHRDVHSHSSQMGQEQVVPDVNVPESYLTPDPSPISSPEPSQAVVKMETMDSEKVMTNGKSSVSILQALEKLASLPHGSVQPTVCSRSNAQSNNPCQENQSSSCKKELPIFDAFDIDNFFDTLEIPEQLSKVSVKVEETKLDREIKTEVPVSSQTAMENMPCLQEIKREVPCYSPPVVYHSCNSPQDTTGMLIDSKESQSTLLSKVKLEAFDMVERNASISSPDSDICGVPNRDLVISSTMIKSPGSVGSQETSAGSDIFDGLLSCFSDDGLDLSPLQTDPRSTILESSLSESMLMEQFEITHEKFYAANTQKPILGHLGQVVPEELSPQSSISSLSGEDDMIDNHSTWALDMVPSSFQSKSQDDIESQCSIKDQEVLGVDNAYSQLDMFFNTPGRFEVSLDFPKHSQ